MQRYGGLQRQGRWRREAVWGTVKEKRWACQVRDGVVEGGGDWSQGNSSDSLCSPTIPDGVLATAHIPKQGDSGWLAETLFEQQDSKKDQGRCV